MNAISLRAATECESATKPKCVCRCGGRFHGARRTADVGTLPPVDPHYPEADAIERVREMRRMAWRMANWYRRQATALVAAHESG